MKKIAIILSGCGYLDGAEIQESVLTLLAIDRAGASASCFAPDMLQYHVVNHLTGEVSGNEQRNVLVESARIVRGAIADVALLDTGQFDALILPGGYGAAKNLSTFAFDGSSCTILPDVTKAVEAFHQAGKPIGFICIAPVIAAKVLGQFDIDVTIGNEAETAAAIEELGAHHRECPVWNCVVSSREKIVSTPAYMLGPSVSEVAKGIDQLVHTVLTLC